MLKRSSFLLIVYYSILKRKEREKKYVYFMKKCKTKRKKGPNTSTGNRVTWSEKKQTHFKKIGTRNVHVSNAVYNYPLYFESLGVKHLEIPTCCSREE